MAKYIKLDDLMGYPIRLDHYDKEHGNENFLFGIESVLEFAQNLPTVDLVLCKDCMNRNFVGRCNTVTGFREYVIVSDNGFCESGIEKTK